MRSFVLALLIALCGSPLTVAAIETERRAYHVQVATEAEANSLYEDITRLRHEQQFYAFKAAAVRWSTDSTSGSRGGDLGWAQAKTFVAPFAGVFASISLNTVSRPVQTVFGWHLLYVAEERPVADTVSLSLTCSISSPPEAAGLEFQYVVSASQQTITANRGGAAPTDVYIGPTEIRFHQGTISVSISRTTGRFTFGSALAMFVGTCQPAGAPKF
jgi:hypothetical protein